MANFDESGGVNAFGHPGIEPRWTVSAKDAVGTAYSTSSRVWYTVSLGILSEIYYPTIDNPQTRDLQFLITDGETFFHEEKRDLETHVECISPNTLGFRITNSDPEDRYRIVKEIISDPHQDVVLLHTRFEGDPDFLSRLKVYVLLAPHLEVGGWGNHGEVRRDIGREVLTAHKQGTWLAMAGDVPFLRTSCGYVGASDGWTDLRDNYRMDWQFDTARDGNIALTGELDPGDSFEFTLGLAFGRTFHRAETALFQALDIPFEGHRDRFVRQWERACSSILPLDRHSHDDGRLYRISNGLLRAHEDKTYQGATIASLSIPWGEVRGDDDIGGYHLVWTRDMCNALGGLVAAGHTETALRAVVYLAAAQHEDGGFPQNFWLDGEAFWSGIQLDGVAFPVLLAWQLREEGALRQFDPFDMVSRAARYLIREGPVTPQERWEEASGYSPSTLASNIAALTCAAAWTRERGDEATADFIQDYADYLEAHLEAWTVTTDGTLLEGASRHFIRIGPASPDDRYAEVDPDHATLILANRPPGSRYEFPAKEIVDAGFLELVRYGIRAAGDPLIEDSLKVIDAVLKVDTPFGPCWRRYNHDGYGQRDDGGPYQRWGTGRAWPLLTGERGHYELAAGRDPAPYLQAMERLSTEVGLLTEQVWDEDDRPQDHMFFGRPTGAAMPLMWAHAEYIKLLRSVRDGRVFDRIGVVEDRYLGDREPSNLEIWKPNRQLRSAPPGARLRIQAPSPFLLRWTTDDWETEDESESTQTSLGISHVDIDISESQVAPVRFVFRSDDDGWDGAAFDVQVRSRKAR